MFTWAIERVWQRCPSNQCGKLNMRQAILCQKLCECHQRSGGKCLLESRRLAENSVSSARRPPPPPPLSFSNFVRGRGVKWRRRSWVIVSRPDICDDGKNPRRVRSESEPAARTVGLDEWNDCWSALSFLGLWFLNSRKLANALDTRLKNPPFLVLLYCNFLK